MKPETNNMPEATVRCGGCGKPIVDGDETRRIAAGKMQKGRNVEKKEWAVLHRSCFNRTVDSPSATLDELNRQARSSR